MTLSCAPVRNGTRLPKGGRFLPGTSRRALCRMIKRPSPGKARDILVACCKRKEGNGIWSIARELMRPYSTIRGWLVRMVRCGLGGRFDRKSAGRKKILNPRALKKIREWTRRDPSRYGFGSASWRLDMVNEMIRKETGRHARPRTLRRILRRLGLSYSKPRVTLIENFASRKTVKEKLNDRRIAEPPMDENSKKIWELTEAMHAERDVRIRNRMMAVLRVLKSHSTKIASDFADVDQRTVQLWVARFDEGGIGGLRDAPSTFYTWRPDRFRLLTIY